MNRVAPGVASGPKKFYNTAVTILPPKSSWNQIQVIRERFDKTYNRWMPHIRVAYPFLGNDIFPRAIENLRAPLSKIHPYEVKLHKISYQTQKNNAVIFARPETVPAGAILETQRAIEQALPDFNDLLIRTENGFEPTLTLGHTEKENVEQVVAEIEKNWSPIEFTVSELYLVSRLGENPLEVRASVQLGGTQPTGEFPENPVVHRVRRTNEERQSSPYKLFVSNLAWNVDNYSLFEAFRDLGATRAFVVYDRLRDRSKGFGFVEFKDEETQLRALQAAQTRELEGRQILVRVAVESAQKSNNTAEAKPELVTEGL